MIYKMKSPVHLTTNSNSTDVVAWSMDNRIAIATEKNVYILTQCCTSSLTDDLLILSHEVMETDAWEHRTFDVNIDTNAIERLGAFSVLRQRFKLNRLLCPEKNAAEFRSFASVKLSPICTDKNRSMVACLTRGNRLTVCTTGHRGQHTSKALHLSDDLYEYARKRAFNLGCAQPSAEQAAKTKDFAESQKRHLSLATTKMEWSEIFRTADDVASQERSDVPTAKRQRLDPACVTESSFILLAAAMKSDHIVLWKLGCPVQEKSSASVGGVIETGCGFATALSWHHPKDTKHHTAFLALGTFEGVISIWRVSNDGDSLDVCKLMDAHAERDDVPVQALSWVNALCTDNSYILVASKGPCILVYQLQLKEGNMTVVHQSHKRSLNTSLISGIVGHDNVVYTSSADGSIQRIGVLQEQDAGLTLDLSLLEPPSHLTSRVDGIALSRNGVYLAVIKRRMSFARRQTSSQLHFITVSSEEDVEKMLLDPTGKLCYKFDCLDWLYQRLNPDAAIQASFGESILTDDPALADLGGAGVRQRLKVRRLTLMMLARKICRRIYETDGKKRSRYEEFHKFQEEKIQAVSRQMMVLHMEDCMMRLSEPQATETQKSKEGRAVTALKLMADWLKRHGSSNKQPVTEDDSEAATESALERCCLCGEDIALTSLEKDSCSNGHCWRRCSLTLLLCQTMKPRKCIFCGVCYASRDETDSDWLRNILGSDCLFCDGPLTDR